MVDVSILLVGYHSRKFIDDCLATLFKFVTGCTYEILLLDCSNDGTIEHVRTRYPIVRVVDNTENLGFSRGNNLLAMHANGRYMLLLNVDVILTDDAITPLLKNADDWRSGKLGAIGGLAYRPDGSRDPGCRQAFPTTMRLFLSCIGFSNCIKGGLSKNAESPQTVETLLGAFMMIPVEVWRRHGGLDESFFAYSEELDFCKRLTDEGLDIVMTPLAKIIHIGNGGFEPASRKVLKTRASMHYIRKHWNRSAQVYAIAGLWLHALLRLVWLTIRSFVGKESAGSAELRFAYWKIICQPKLWCEGFVD